MSITVGITGMQNLQAYDPEALEQAVRDALAAYGQPHAPRVLLSSLAAGADQLCTRIGLTLGYTFLCVLPFPDYRGRLRGEALAAFDTLLSQARETIVVSDGTDAEAAYLAAGQYVADHCDVLLAVWDGKPQKSACGTEAVVRYARQQCRPVRLIAP